MRTDKQTLTAIRVASCCFVQIALYLLAVIMLAFVVRHAAAAADGRSWWLLRCRGLSSNIGHIALKFHRRHQQVLPKAIWEECVAIPHDGEFTPPLRVLAVQCSLRTSPVTHPRVPYIGLHTTLVLSLLTHRSLTLIFYPYPNPSGAHYNRPMRIFLSI